MTAASDITFPAREDIPVRFLPGSPIAQRCYLVDGELRQWDGPRQEVYSPIFLRTTAGPQPVLLGSYPLLSAGEALAALDAACRAFDHGRGDWPTMTIEERIRHLERFTYRLKEKRDEIVTLLMWEIGKSLGGAEKEFDRTVDYIQETIGALKDLDRASSRFVTEQGVIAQIRRAPLGVVLCMGPFNYPLNETFATLIPALIMGNTVVFKPPKLGVILHAPLLEAFRDCFPPGVINTVYGHGREIVSPLMQSGRIDVLAFIGTSRVADMLKSQHPKPHRLRSVLGLEAKNAAIVLADADLELAVCECLSGSLAFNGQRCTALKMLYVHRRVAEDFLQRFTAAVENMKIGMPWEEGVVITPLPEAEKIDYLQALVEDAVARGGRVLNRGGGTVRHSLFVPAVVSPVSPQSRLYREEQFGPVVPVAVFDDLAEPLEYIVQSDYGQQVSLFGQDPDTLARLIDPLVNQVCRVNINSQCQRGPDIFPFTGRKDSAEGTLSVTDALRVFSIRTLVAAKDHALNQNLFTEIVRERKSKFLSTDFLF